MQKRSRILAIIPKTTSTTIAIFLNDVCILKETIEHREANMSIDEQVSYRKEAITKLLMELGINMSKLDAITASGGLIRPVEGGTYIVCEKMCQDLKNNYNGKHASNLGGLIAYDIARDLNMDALIVDPPVVDELHDIARISGFPNIERKSVFHALNHKAVARLAAEELSKEYDETNLLVAHLGNGITVGVHENGKVIDVNNGLHGEGPFSLERAGSIPIEDLIKLCFSKNLDQQTLIHEITFESGLKGYLQIDSIDTLEKALQNNEEETLIIIKAMAYQIAKEIGAMSTVLNGNIDGIVLTGPLSRIQLLTDLITTQINWIADVHIFPGDYDMEALNAGTLRVLQKKEKVKQYMN